MTASRRLAAPRGGGGRVDISYFLTEKTPEHFATEAARTAILQLGAVAAPAGEMEVVLGPGWPGVLLHEAVGHGLEADFNRKKTSAFAGLIGRQVASSKVHSRRQRHDAFPSRFTKRRRRRLAHAGNGTDRKRHPQSATSATSSRRAL